MSHALVIAAHGSHYSPGTALPAWTCVDAIRQTGLFDEVAAAFWKDQPAFGSVLESLRSQEVTVVPLFSSEGYFSQEVLPAELQPRSDQRLHITPAAGQHEYFFTAINRRIETAWQKASWKKEETAAILVGHGTPKNPANKNVTEQQARLLAAGGRFAEVLTAYLDETPYIHDVYEATHQPNLVIPPFFIAEGLHTQADIPAALGLSEPFYEPQVIRDRTVIYLPPVGMADDLYKVVLALAGQDPDAPLNGSLWDAFPVVPADLLAGESVGEIWLCSPNYLCHIADHPRPPDELIRLETPAAIREKLRLDANGQFRPLASRKDLPHGWIAPTPDRGRRAAALETIYPALGAASQQPRSVQAVGIRQRGKYRPAADLGSVQIARLVARVCDGCIRHPIWHTEQLPSQPLCIEPCSIWLEESLR